MLYNIVKYTAIELLKYYYMDYIKKAFDYKYIYKCNIYKRKWY